MSEDFRFHYIVYKMAFIIEGNAREPFTIMEINWNSPDVVHKLCKFSKDSILHQYIFSTIATYFQRDYRKNADMYELSDIEDIEATFKEYGIKIYPYESFYKKRKKVLKAVMRHFTIGIATKRICFHICGKQLQKKYFSCFLQIVCFY